jgi:hypothetical protein
MKNHAMLNENFFDHGANIKQRMEWQGRRWFNTVRLIALNADNTSGPSIFWYDLSGFNGYVVRPKPKLHFNHFFALLRLFRYDIVFFAMSELLNEIVVL